MKPKYIIAIAIILGLLAALGVNNYLVTIKDQVQEEQKPLEVLVANKDIDKGTSIAEILNKNMAELKKVPRKYVASQAISSARHVEGRVLSVPVSAGEQLTSGKFRLPSEAGLSFSVPDKHIAISVPYDDIRGVAGLVKPGDLVTVFATFDPSGSDDEFSRILLQKVQVLAIDSRVSEEKRGSKSDADDVVKEANDAGNIKTVTLALSPSDAEKLVFSQEVGKVWFALHPYTGAEAVTTNGRTLVTIFDR